MMARFCHRVLKHYISCKAFDVADESINIIVSTHKILLLDYIKLLSMLLHPPVHDWKFLLEKSSWNRISL